MPIPIDQLQTPIEDELPLEDQIVDFLERDPNRAYSLLEILAALRGFPNVDAALAKLETWDELEQERLIHQYRSALGYLILEDKIVAAEHQGEGYYFLRQR